MMTNNNSNQPTPATVVAITKKGTPCKRCTGIGKLCFQHGGGGGGGDGNRAITATTTTTTTITMDSNNNNQVWGITKDGKPCRNCRIMQAYCYHHRDQRPTVAASTPASAVRSVGSTPVCHVIDNNNRVATTTHVPSTTTTTTTNNNNNRNNNNSRTTSVSANEAPAPAPAPAPMRAPAPVQAPTPAPVPVPVTTTAALRHSTATTGTAVTTSTTTATSSTTPTTTSIATTNRSSVGFDFGVVGRQQQQQQHGEKRSRSIFRLGYDNDDDETRHIRALSPTSKAQQERAKIAKRTFNITTVNEDDDDEDDDQTIEMPSLGMSHMYQNNDTPDDEEEEIVFTSDDDEDDDGVVPMEIDDPFQQPEESQQQLSNNRLPTLPRGYRWTTWEDLFQWRKCRQMIRDMGGECYVQNDDEDDEDDDEDACVFRAANMWFNPQRYMKSNKNEEEDKYDKMYPWLSQKKTPLSSSPKPTVVEEEGLDDQRPSSSPSPPPSQPFANTNNEPMLPTEEEEQEEEEEEETRGGDANVGNDYDDNEEDELVEDHNHEDEDVFDNTQRAITVTFAGTTYTGYEQLVELGTEVTTHFVGGVLGGQAIISFLQAMMNVGQFIMNSMATGVNEFNGDFIDQVVLVLMGMIWMISFLLSSTNAPSRGRRRQTRTRRG